ncbi:hypothetical protein ABIB40_000577 [Pedobacter sp. UYP30]|uniref:hypothetical protein n=1 Tax=Pedobacter sp. UYP30 TaxID=1756400 RepID=UPI003395DA45
MKLILYIILFLSLITVSCNEHNATPNVGQLNKEASLPANFNFSQMGLKVIASTINKKLFTMSTLYGNDAAKITAQHADGKCLAGSVFALVNWKQQPDERWIGANIPGNLLSVEMLKTAKDQENGTALYTRFTGADLKIDSDTSGQSIRAKYIIGLKPSIMF